MTRQMKTPRTSTKLPSAVARLQRAGLTTCLLGALLIPLSSGPATAEDRANWAPDPATWSSWLQRHLQIEQATVATRLEQPDSATVAAWLQRHHELEHGG